MKLLNLRFVCRFHTPARLSAWKGSMLRGVLGSNLRRCLCIARREDCSSCPVGEDCVFTKIFNPLARDNRPPPFCVEPNQDFITNFQAGDAMKFDLKLFSYGAEYMTFYIQAFKAAGLSGLGNRALRGEFAVEEILLHNQNIYDAEKDYLIVPEAGELDWPDIARDAGENRLDLNIIAPLRYKSGNQFSNRLEFLDLFNLIVRRVKSLALLDGLNWQMDKDLFARLRETAAKIRIIQNDLVWRDLDRYSSRQGAAMKFGGVTGNISWFGPVSIFRDFLNFAKTAHIGKQTSFGLGMLDYKMYRN